MNSRMMHQIVEMIESEAHARPSPMEFEMAYQARVAMDRIRFAIKHAEQFGPQTEPLREAGLQLLDALQRLETVDRRFQKRSQVTSERNPESDSGWDSAHGKRPSHRADGLPLRD